MRWRVLLAAAAFASAAQAECITPVFEARPIFHRAVNVVRAVAISETGLRVSSVILGTSKIGDVIRFMPRECRYVSAGSEYVAWQHCIAHADCAWTWFDATRTPGIAEYIRDRHFVTRKQIVAKLAAWRRDEIETPALRKWIATSDVDDDDDVDAPLSLNSEVLDTLEELAAEAEAAERCDPRAARTIRKDLSGDLLDLVAQLPKEEKQSEYNAWLDAHPNEVDRWDETPLTRFKQRVTDLPARTPCSPAGHSVSAAPGDRDPHSWSGSPDPCSSRDRKRRSG